ncbi:MAG: histidinol-phosphate transaminase [Mariprofundaceae bacterium]|nr:histidinol-phosphate transaminase [Mariprofundaceae bacterium]
MNQKTPTWLDRAVIQTASLHPYVPGKSLEQLLRETGLSKAIKLASNENPYGSPPAAIIAMQQACATTHRYPDGDSTALKKALAKQHDVDPARILLGNGSNEVLELLIRCFADHKAQVIYSRRSFIVYALATLAAGAHGVAVEDDADWGHDLVAMLAAVSQYTRVVCIANPNNPTGTLLANASIQGFLDALPRDVVVIVDEAYHEYVAETHANSIAYLYHPGLVITRTFSKAYGLAGCRIGYGIGDAELIACANRFREPFNLNSIGQAGALAALGEQLWVKTHVVKLLFERDVLEKALQERGLLLAHSDGNFVLLRHANAMRIHALMEQQGIILRPLVSYSMPDVLRVSVGTSAENHAFLRKLDQVLTQL